MLKRVITAWRNSMPDLNFKIQDTIAQGDKVAMRLTRSGSYRAIFFPTPLPPHRVILRETFTPAALGPRH